VLQSDEKSFNKQMSQEKSISEKLCKKGQQREIGCRVLRESSPAQVHLVLIIGHRKELSQRHDEILTWTERNKVQ